jgi:hypothetical protein
MFLDFARKAFSWFLTKEKIIGYAGGIVIACAAVALGMPAQAVHDDVCNAKTIQFPTPTPQPTVPPAQGEPQGS